MATQPLMVVIGDKPGGFGAYRDGCEIYARAASKQKELVVAKGWSHYDLYDQPEPAGLALSKTLPFFKATSEPQRGRKRCWPRSSYERAEK